MRKNIIRKRKWEQDISQQEEEDVGELLRGIRPQDLKDDDDNNKDSNQNNDTLHQQNPLQPNPTTQPHVSSKKPKQFAWMSDSDEPLPPAPPPTAQPSKIQPPQEALQPQIDVYITKLPIKATEGDLDKHFGKFGRITELYMPTNQGTELNKGKAFMKIQLKEGEEFFGKEHKVRGEVVEVKSGYGERAGENQEERRKRSRSRSRSRDKGKL